MKQNFLLRAGENRAADVEGMAQFARQCLPDKRVLVTIEDYHEERSTPQNKALFGHAYKLMRDALGFEVNEVHEVCCGMYFGWVEYEVLGETRRRPRRTTTKDDNGKRDVLGRKEFSAFFESVQRWAATAGVHVPNPDPEYFARMKE